MKLAEKVLGGDLAKLTGMGFKMVQKPYRCQRVAGGTWCTLGAELCGRKP